VADLTWHVGDTRTVLATLDAGSVDLVVTSPPFLALRSYLPADDPAKRWEMGSEATPGAFLDALLDVVEGCARVLAPHGSMCFELGDTYSGSGGAGGDYGEGGLREGQAGFAGSAAAKQRTDGGRYPGGYLRNDGRKTGQAEDYEAFDVRPANGGPGWPLAKSLCLIPELFRVALVYGFNPLTGRETPRWRARNVIRWVRPNPPVGALGDKWRPATSEMVVVCKAADRYFDQDATRTPSDRTEETCAATERRAGRVSGTFGSAGMKDIGDRIQQNPGGAPLLDWWKISPKGFQGSHYATFPAALCIPPIRAMCPEKVCQTCGKPSRRIVGEATYPRNDSNAVPARLAKSNGTRVAAGVNQHHQENGANTSVTRSAPTIGWTDCGHGDWRPGVVLDPFVGSGTVIDAALGQGRSAVGIDLDVRNLDLARDRLGMFPLTVVDHLTKDVPA